MRTFELQFICFLCIFAPCITNHIIDTSQQYFYFKIYFRNNTVVYCLNDKKVIINKMFRDDLSELTYTYFLSNLFLLL